MGNGTPYVSGPHVVECYGGGETRVELRAPHRGVIRGIRFEQIAGDDSNCKFELYTSRRAAPPEPVQLSSSSGASFPAGGSSESLNEAVDGARTAYSVFGEKSMASGTPFADYDANYMYSNRDGTPTNPQRKVLGVAGRRHRQQAIRDHVDHRDLSVELKWTRRF